jgi:VWFA-related protein
MEGTVKKTVSCTALFFLCIALFAQVEQHDVTVTNIMVPVRVFDGDEFIDSLKIENFELFEDGVPQNIEALYLAKKDRISREEEYKEFFPATNRSFYLIFQLTDYHPKLEGVIDFFFESVIVPGDTLTIQTPIKNYTLSQNALKTRSKKAVAAELKKILRKDIQVGSTEYNSLIRDLSRLVRAIQSSAGFGSRASATGGFETDQTDDQFGIEFLLPRYRNSLNKLDNLRVADEKKFLAFASHLKDREGQKNVFFFYQREFRPEIAPVVLNQMEAAYQDRPEVLGAIQELYMFYNRDLKMDLDRLTQAFSDSGMLFHFIFMSKDKKYISGIHMNEQSEDVFKALSNAAKATGGFMDSSHNPEIAFRNVINATEYYYILYYSPIDYRADGAFKNIEVRVKEKNYKLNYRTGYYAK